MTQETLPQVDAPQQGPSKERIFTTYSNATASPKSEQLFGEKLILGHHKAINYIDKNGKRFVIEGTPEHRSEQSFGKALRFLNEELLSNGKNSSDSEFGRLQMQDAEISADKVGNPDTDPYAGLPEETISVGENLSKTFERMRELMFETLKQDYEYRPLTQNSNSIVDQVIKDAGLAPLKEIDDKGVSRNAPGSHNGLHNPGASPSPVNPDQWTSLNETARRVVETLGYAFNELLGIKPAHAPGFKEIVAVKNSSVTVEYDDGTRKTFGFTPDGSAPNKLTFEDALRRRTSEIKFVEGKSRTTKTFNPQGKVVREQRYDASGNVTFDSKIERQKKQAAAAAEAKKQAAAKVKAEKKAAAKADAEKKAAAKAEAQKKAAAKVEAERLRKIQEAADAQRALEEQNRRLIEESKRRDQVQREDQERRRKMQEQRQREDEERRRQAAAEQARRDAEADRLRRQMDATRIPGSGSGTRPAPGVPTPTPRPSLPPRGPWIGAPVALDLNGDGVLDIHPLDDGTTIAASRSDKPLDGNVQPVKAPPVFDWDGDGVADQTAWVAPKDGLLVIDLAADGKAGPDGKIDQPHEIAFALWKTEDERQAELKAQGIDDTGRPVTDLEGLRYAFDTNGDNVLDARDARWSEFRVWQDHNQNGVTDDGELRTLDEVGIKFINLLPSPEGARAFTDGSAITGTSTAQKVDGASMLVGDVTLAFQPSALG
ncbi:hypothetical protein [Agrobacterium tumefaciens]|uniref:hypothetical protein n=1 Tax=Agrobacterium tumefaciens TaxID=358 RepID=UPI0039A71F18